MVKRTLLKIFNREFQSINEAALLLGFFTLFSQVLGLLRDRLFAGSIGAGLELDIYYTAFRIPDILFAFAASMVSVTILIPFFMERYKKDDEDAASSRKFINEVFTVFFGFIVIASLIVFVCMPWLSKIIAPGFTPEALVDLTQLSRIMLLSPILLGLSNLLGTITQAFKKFFVYALAPIFYNGGIILGVVFFYPIFGLPGLAYGVGLGALLHLLIQLPVVIQQGYFPEFTLNIDWQDIKRIVFISLPRTFTLSINKIIIAVLIAVASTLTAGSVSIFNFAWNLQNVPLALIGMSFSVAAFPTLVKLYTDNDQENFLKQLVAPARQIIFWSIPVVMLFIVLRAQIVRVILGTGAFSWNDTRLTAAALALFAISVMFQSLILLLVRGYYAAGKTWKPLAVTIVGAGASIGSAFLFVSLFEKHEAIRIFIESTLRVTNVPGTSVLMLALAYTVGEAIRFGVMWMMFRWEFMRTYRTGLRRVVAQTLSASLIAGAVAYEMLDVFDNIFDINTFQGVFLQGFLSGIIAIIILIVVLLLLKNEEVIAIKKVFTAKNFWRTKILGSDVDNIS